MKNVTIEKATGGYIVRTWGEPMNIDAGSTHPERDAMFVFTSLDEALDKARSLLQ